VGSTDTQAEAGFGPRFALVVCSSAFYFVGIGMLAPVLPRYVKNVLHGGGVEVGVAVGAFAVSAALLRSVVGRLGDRRGRRVLVVGGGVVVGLSVFGYGLDGLATLVLMRLISGAGEAAVFVGAATTAQDLAPADRRGQAASLFSISVYGGIAVGPPIGEWISRSHGDGPVWVTAGSLCLVAALVGTGLPRWTQPPSPGAAEIGGASRRFLHPSAVRPGIILALGAMGYAGFSSFVPLYADRLGLRGAGPVFIEYAAIVLAVRIVGSRLPDVLGARRGPLVALGLQTFGLLLMGTWASAFGLYVATAIYAFGVSLLYPALVSAVVQAAPDAERGHAIATFTLFFDVSQGFGALLLGAVVAATNEQGAFVAAGCASAAGWWLHRSTRSLSSGRAPLAQARGTPEPYPPPEPGE
jgi:MFS family permease